MYQGPMISWEKQLHKKGYIQSSLSVTLLGKLVVAEEAFSAPFLISNSGVSHFAYAKKAGPFLKQNSLTFRTPVCRFSSKSRAMKRALKQQRADDVQCHCNKITTLTFKISSQRGTNRRQSSEPKSEQSVCVVSAERIKTIQRQVVELCIAEKYSKFLTSLIKAVHILQYNELCV